MLTGWATWNWTSSNKYEQSALGKVRGISMCQWEQIKIKGLALNGTVQLRSLLTKKDNL